MTYADSGAITALRGLLALYDPESGTIDVRPEPSCTECTAGTTPNHLNRGPCAYHRALAVVAQAEGRTP